MEVPVSEKRWKVGRQNKIAQIRDAAIIQFCKQGYAGSSLNDIAKALDMHKATLYHYFPSKELLLGHILDFAHDQIGEIIATADALDASSIERLCMLLKLQICWYLENVELARVTFHEWTNVGEQLIEAQTERRRTYDKFLRSQIALAKKEGLIDRDVNVSLAANFITGAINAAPAWFTRDGSLSAEQVADVFAAMALRTLGASESAGAADLVPPRKSKTHSG